MSTVSELRIPLVTDGKTIADVTNDVCKPVENRPTIWWWAAFIPAVAAMIMFFVAVGHTIATGLGVWGLNRTVDWGFGITNFVFWVGIGHAGTLISAILLIFRQKWRTSINRAAEAMTIFAVICAGSFPLIHMGRIWLAFWLLPYPNSRGPLWVNFRSPLLWDVFAISTYLTISAVFWYIGLVPDLASVRDRAKNKVRRFVYGVLSMGWNGSAKTWARHEMTSMLLAGLAAPLVLSVHTVVSFDFATSVIPGWHATIFPPYFVAGAVFSGFGMVLTLLIVARKTMALESYITIKHLENMAKVLIATGSMVGLAYGTEFFIAWYSQNPYEMFTFINRATGPYWWAYWIMVSCNVISPQLLWFEKIRTSPVALFILSIFVNIGMWFERFVIVVTSLHRDYIPSSWSYYRASPTELAILVGSFGLFFTLFLLFIRFFPAVAMAEVKAVRSYAQHGGRASAPAPTKKKKPKAKKQKGASA